MSDDFERMKRDRAKRMNIMTEEQAQEAGTPVDGPRIVVADDSEIARFQTGRVCGECRNFRHRLGQEEAAKQQLFQRVTDKQEIGHDLSWYGNPQMFGMCDVWEGHLPHAMAPCTIPKHLMDSSVSYHDKDAKVDCPYYAKKGSFRSQLKCYQGGGKTYDPS